MTYFLRWVTRAALVISAFVVSTATSAQVTWSVVDGKVAGAQNVNVGGLFYDVVFGDQYVTERSFVNQTFAWQAGRALVEQVFVSAAPLDLDINPGAMAGCSATCWVATVTNTTFIPGNISRNESDRIFSPYLTYAVNNDAGSIDESVFFSGFIMSTDQSSDPRTTFASWTPSVAAAVPEPKSYALVMAGLGLIGAVVRRRKAKLD